MKAGILFSTIIMGGILLSAGNSLAGGNPPVRSLAGGDKGAESIVLQGGSMAAVTFPHGRHQAIFVDCKPCHELFPQQSQAVDRMKGEGKLQKKDVMNMCKKCHTDLTDKGQKAGPTACKDCHKK